MQNTANKVDIKCLKKEDLCSEIHATKSPQLIENVNDEGEQNANDSVMCMEKNCDNCEILFKNVLHDFGANQRQ